MTDLKEDSQTLPILPSNPSTFISDPYLQHEYYITSYPLNIEDHSKVSKIIPLRMSNCKYTLYIITNIFTLTIINLFLTWFPSMKLCLLYSTCSLLDATHVGVYGVDGVLTVCPLQTKTNPDFDMEISQHEAFTYNIIHKFNMNINYNCRGSHLSKLIMFNYKLYDFVFNETTQSFVGLRYHIETTQNTFHNEYVKALTLNEAAFMRSIFGECDIDIKIHSVWSVLLKELTDPFYLFQLYSVILWCVNEYYFYSGVIVILTIISLIASVYDTRTNLIQLHEMSKYSCDVNLYRKNPQGETEIQKVNSVELVPGDLFEIPDDGYAMPCDAILVNGSVIINESMLTGESTPILKTHLQDVKDVTFDTRDIQVVDKYLLFAGTKVVQKRSLGKYKALAVAYSTGFNTVKGQLIRAILFPKSTNEKFQKDSTKYIVFMSVLCVIGFVISLKFLIETAGLTTYDIVIKFLDLITTTVPPSLPACISVGITYSLMRLKRYKIICISRERVNMAGKVNVICFDKTGTLTEDHLQIAGYVPVKLSTSSNNTFTFDKYITDVSIYNNDVYNHYKHKMLDDTFHNKNEDLKQLFVECLACCHGISQVKAKLVGDPIDVEMFQGIKWNIKENITTQDDNNSSDNDPVVLAYIRPYNETDLRNKLENMTNVNDEDDIIKTHYEIGLVRRFEFSSKLQRMTTLVKNANEPYYKAFCKGSPEKIRSLCKDETIPLNYNAILSSYTSRGYRVLALAMKCIKMKYTQSQKVSREFIENNMIFLGLLVVQNKLKETTTRIINEIDTADIRMIMATGDNILTAISVSKECKLVNPNTDIYTCSLESGELGKDTLTWMKIDSYDVLASSQGVVEIAEERTMSDVVVGCKLSSSKVSDSKGLFDVYPAVEFVSKNEGSVSKVDTVVDNCDNNNNRCVVSDNTLIQQHEHNNNNNNDNEDSSNTNNNDLIIEYDNSELKTYSEQKYNYVIAITGNTFEQLYKYNAKYLKHNNNMKYYNYHKTFKDVLQNGIIFARMSPEHKALLIESFKTENCTILMCGDGANDCSALRTADVGVSLSPEEASIAAHFTSHIPDISCLPPLLKEGKGSLATSIQTFKYMMMYSIIQFLALTLLMCFLTYLDDFQFLTCDLFIIFPLAFFIAQTPPYHHLTHHYPLNDLLSFPVMFSIISQSIISFTFMLGGRMVLAYTHSWYSNTCYSEDEWVTACEDNTVFFLISNTQYLTVAIAFCVAKPFRQPIYTNWMLVLYLVIVGGYTTWVVLRCDSFSQWLFTLYSFEDIDKGFKYWLYLVICVNGVVSVFVEWVVMNGVRKCWERYVVKKYKKRIKEGEEVGIYEIQRVFYWDRRNKKERKED